jgi:hypothetical protein
MVTITGGDKLAAYLADLSKKVQRKSVLKAGFLEGAKYDDGTPVAMVAAIQNFGAPARGIPPRPFMTNAVTEHGEEWGQKLATLLKTADFNAETALTQLGAEVVADIQQAISDLDSPPLSPVTLMLRKMHIGRKNDPITFAEVLEARRRVAAGEDPGGASDKPLVYSGHMRQSVDFEVE